jgi:hypothetical protein
MEHNTPNQMNADGMIVTHSVSEYRRLKEQGVQNVLPPQSLPEKQMPEDDFPLGQACDPKKLEECQVCQ